MKRRLALQWAITGAAAAQELQKSRGNPAACPGCKKPSDGCRGYLLTSVEQNVVTPAVNRNVEVHVCPACGLIYGALPEHPVT